MADYPDFFKQELPGQTVQVSEGYQDLWYWTLEQSVASSTETFFNCVFPNDGYVYQIHAIYVTLASTGWVLCRAALNDLLLVGDAQPGSCYINVSQCPAVYGVYTDTLKVRCWHYEGSNKDIRVVVIGSKFLEPDAGFKPAVAAFHATPLTGTTPLTVQFSDDSLYNPSSWDWDFGDGSPHAYTQNPIHVYDSEGDFDVKLTVANSVGSASTTKSDYVKVHNYENLSGYTEYDPDSIFTVSTYQVAVTGYKQSYRGYVYKDYGSNYFNGIDISFECKDIPSGISAQIGLVCFANNLWQYWSSSTSDVTVSFYAPSGTAHYIRIALGGYTSRQDLAITAGNTYYCRLYRAANSATVTLYVYSDAAHNNLVGSVYTTLGSSATKWRYKFVVNSANVSDSSAFNIYIKNVSYGSGT